MTTTSTFQGKDGNRNTSRVLAPPGGGSSNIFGAEERTQPAANRYQDNDIFGQGDSAATQPLHTGKSIANKPVDDSAANVFGGARQASNDEAYYQKTRVPNAPTKSAEEEAQGQQMFRAKAKASSHNPVTWQPNPGQDNVDGMEPLETLAGRGRNLQQAKGGSYNILTGEDYGYQEPAARAGKKHIQQGQDTRPW